MIVRMSKYTFVLYHAEQEAFLSSLQELGLVDITSTAWEPDDRERSMLTELEQHRAAKIYLSGLASEPGFEAGEPFADGAEAFEAYVRTRAAMEELSGRMDKARKEVAELEVWGEFMPAQIRQLRDSGVTLRFFSVFDSEFETIRMSLPEFVVIEEMSLSDGRTYLVTVSSGEMYMTFDSQEHRIP